MYLVEQNPMRNYNYIVAHDCGGIIEDEAGK